MTLLDTSFVIDLLREQTRRQHGPAHGLLDDLAGESLALPLFVVCELEAGAARSSHPGKERERLGVLMGVLPTVLPDDRIPRAYGDLLARIQRSGKNVATMDLLIATQAIVEDAQLATRNRKHFESVPGLRILSY